MQRATKAWVSISAIDCTGLLPCGSRFVDDPPMDEGASIGTNEPTISTMSK